MPFYFRFDCADYMREPSDIAVGGREFYVCDFKVMSLTNYNLVPQFSTSQCSSTISQGHNVVVFTEEGVFVRRIG